MLPLFIVLLTSTWQPSDGRDSICLSPVCEYDLEIRRAQTMVYTDPSTERVFDVALNESGKLVVVSSSFHSIADYPDIIGRVVEPENVITADGKARDVIVVNGKFVGPTLEVVEGATVMLPI